MTTSALLSTQPSPRSTAVLFYRPGLDLLRVLAFLLVFMAHSLVSYLELPTQLGAVARGGEFGVAIFFFLSAYLITELLLREKAATGTVAVGAFYARRILRIWPLYFVVIAACFAFGLVSPSHTISLGWMLSLVLLCGNWYTVGHGYPPAFLYPLWSLSIEEQFYLLWPFLVKKLSPAGLLLVAAGFIAGAYATLAWLLGHHQSLDPAVWVNSLVQFQFFALGTALAVLLHRRSPRLSAGMRLASFAAGLLCLRAAQAAVFVNDPGLEHNFAHIAPRFAIALVGCLLLFFSCLNGGTGRMARPFVYLGKISYGLYVFHVLWLGLVRDVLRHTPAVRWNSLAYEGIVMAIALTGTIVTAAMSYRYLETPFLAWKKRFTVVESRPPEAVVLPHRIPRRPRLKAS